VPDLASGNTPTGVGKTCKSNYLGCMYRKHPHGRGEDYLHAAFKIAVAETPPRAWGRLSRV